MACETHILTVTLGGETREVEFKTFPGGSNPTLAMSRPIGAARVGRGVKAHRVMLLAWRKDTASPFLFKGQCDNVLNRQAALIGWADKFEGTSAGSKSSGWTI